MEGNQFFLTQVIQRYDNRLQRAAGYFFTDLYLNGLDKEFIFAVLGAFETNAFDAAEFEPFSIEMIVDYIQRTHTFYLQKKLPELEQSILLLSEAYNANHPLLAALNNLFRRYCKELAIHIREEEDKLLPYIVLLRNAERTPKHFSAFILTGQKYSLAQFLAEHHDTEDELAQIRNTIRIYNPPPTNLSLYRILLTQLQTFEEDLRVHALMEEKVLIPKALKIERKLIERLEQSPPFS